MKNSLSLPSQGAVSTYLCQLMLSKLICVSLPGRYAAHPRAVAKHLTSLVALPLSLQSHFSLPVDLSTGPMAPMPSQWLQRVPSPQRGCSPWLLALAGHGPCTPLKHIPAGTSPSDVVQILYEKEIELKILAMNLTTQHVLC